MFALLTRTSCVRMSQDLIDEGDFLLSRLPNVQGVVFLQVQYCYSRKQRKYLYHCLSFVRAVQNDAFLLARYRVVNPNSKDCTQKYICPWLSQPNDRDTKSFIPRRNYFR